MVDPVTRTRLAHQLLFLAIAAAVVFAQVLPFRIGGGRVPGPDILVLMAFAWVMRRPDFVPPLLAGGVVLAADVLFMRPIGLWAALAVAGLEFLRGRSALSRDLPFLVEWFTVSGVLLLMTLANAAALMLTMVPRAPLGLDFLQLIVSCLSYPLVVALTARPFGVGKLAPGEVDALGHRL